MSRKYFPLPTTKEWGGSGRGETSIASVVAAPLPVPLPARPSRGEGEQPCNGGSARIRSAAQRLAFEEQNFALEGGDGVWLKSPSLQRRRRVVGYPSGQRGQTVNLLAYAFAGSNPAPTTTLHIQRGTAV